MKDFSIREILGLLRRTAPFLVFRFLIYFGITLAYVIATGGGVGVGYMIGHVGNDPGAWSVWGGIAGFGLVGVVIYWFREYLLYLVKAGHIAVLVELMDGRELPQGRGQIDHAQAIVRERFAEASILFAVDQLIKGVIKAFNRVFFGIMNLLPIPGIQGIAKFINTIVRLSLTYLDEVILAYNIRTGTTNPWASSQTALVLYAQNYKAFLRNAFFLAFVIWGLTFVVFLVSLAPAAGLVALFPGTGGFITMLIAIVFAWGVKAAIIEPFAMTALMQVFFKVTEGQQPNPEWESKLNEVSGKFGEMGRKAREWAGGGTASAASAAPEQGQPGA